MLSIKVLQIVVLLHWLNFFGSKSFNFVVPLSQEDYRKWENTITMDTITRIMIVQFVFLKTSGLLFHNMFFSGYW